ncbi:EH signature domain-containing protein [Solidesulfovibrio alcoholivorans]|uniref:EH signature domain-containing protein n=1 Tax=Solidesulfovibrio alcoholivorans TaxID=81406 RepID=UPI0009FD9A21|nr:EH signature domain-containing protein [Solidesulfovibrio alcoholivorans]
MTQGLKDLLLTWQQSGYQIRPLVFCPSRAVEAAKLVGEGTDQPTRPPLDLQALQVRLIQAARSQDFSGLDVLDWRYSTLCLDKSVLLEDLSLLRAYLKALAQRARGRLLRGLARVYVDIFTSFPQAARELATFLARRVDSLGRRWSEAAFRFELFKPTVAVDRLASWLLNPEVGVEHGIVVAFDHAGLPTSLAISEFGIKAFQVALQRPSGTGNKSLTQEMAQRIIDLSTTAQGCLFLNVPPVIQAITDALLLPFRVLQAPNAVRNLVETFLLRQLRDPRLDASLWHPVRIEAKDVMHGWLTEQSLELFLSIMDNVANQDNNARRMWMMRGKFWRAYHRKGYIDQAWVALGVNGVHEVKKIIARTGSSPGKALSYAELTQSTNISNHIALIMKIDTLIVVDWSHNGRCHIWHERNNDAPALYKRFYRKTDLDFNSEKPGPYTHYAKGSWREDVAKHIREQTGRSVFPNDYN